MKEGMEHEIEFIVEKSKNEKLVNIITITLMSIVSVLAIVPLSLSSTSLKGGFLLGARERVENLENQYSTMNADLASIKDTLTQIDNNDGLDISQIKTQLNQMEDAQEILKETILIDADKALTARLLLDKQKEIEEEIGDLKSEFIRIDDKFDQLIYAIIIIPIIGLIVKLAFEKILTWFTTKKEQETKT